VEVHCSLIDNVYQALAVGFQTDGQLKKGGVVFELVAQLVQDPPGIGACPIQFVDESNAGYFVPEIEKQNIEYEMHEAANAQIRILFLQTWINILGSKISTVSDPVPGLDFLQR